MVRIGFFSSSHASTKEKSILDKGIASAKVLKNERAWWLKKSKVNVYGVNKVEIGRC